MYQPRQYKYKHLAQVLLVVVVLKWHLISFQLYTVSTSITATTTITAATTITTAAATTITTITAVATTITTAAAAIATTTDQMHLLDVANVTDNVTNKEQTT